MKKYLLLLTLIVFLLPNTIAQDSYLKNRMNLKLSYSRFPTGRASTRSGELRAVSTGHIRLEACYGIYNFIEGGLYLGYSKYETLIPNSDSSFYTPENAHGYFYGVLVNFHVLPLLISEDDFRFDLYLATKIGGLLLTSDENSLTEPGNDFDFFVGPGLSFYLWDHIGINFECGYYQNRFKDHYSMGEKWFSARYRLTFKF